MASRTAGFEERNMQATPEKCTERLCDPTEQRWGQRVALSTPVDIGSGRILAHGVLRNASLSGALVETALDLPVFSHLVVRWQPPGTTVPQDLAACVVRRTDTGFAVEWRDMACEPLLALLRSAGAELSQLTAPDHVFS